MPKTTLLYGLLCDTSFLIRLNKSDDPLHKNARGYLKFAREGGHQLYVSSIALAEYAAGDRIQNLPIPYFRILPFNIDHAQRAGEFAASAFARRKHELSDLTQRLIIPNDTKMFAQADVTLAITHFLTADDECKKVYEAINIKNRTNFKILSLSIPYHQAFGTLDLGQ